MTEPKTADYGSWKSPITSDLIASGVVRLDVQIELEVMTYTGLKHVQQRRDDMSLYVSHGMVKQPMLLLNHIMLEPEYMNTAVVPS